MLWFEYNQKMNRATDMQELSLNACENGPRQIGMLTNNSIRRLDCASMSSLLTHRARLQDEKNNSLDISIDLALMWFQRKISKSGEKPALFSSNHLEVKVCYLWNS